VIDVHKNVFAAFFHSKDVVRGIPLLEALVVRVCQSHDGQV